MQETAIAPGIIEVRLLKREIDGINREMARERGMTLRVFRRGPEAGGSEGPLVLVPRPPQGATSATTGRRGTGTAAGSTTGTAPPAAG